MDPTVTAPPRRSAPSGPRRVCLHLNSWTFGGVEEHVATLAGQLPRLGYEPVVVCAELGALGPLYDRLSSLGVQLRTERPGGRFRAPVAVTRVARLLRAERIDVMHVQLVSFDGGRIPMLAARLAGVPVVVTHHIAPRATAQGLARWKRSALLRSVDHFIAVSDANRIDQARSMGLPPHRFTAIHNGVVIPSRTDHTRMHRTLTDNVGLPSDAKLIGAVGRFVGQKGFHRLLSAAARVVAEVPGAHFVFVGDGPLRANLEAQASDLGISHAVHFLGFRRDVAQILAGIDVLALSSYYEGLPLVVLEAFAAGRPVVAFAVDGIPEAIDDGVNGFLVTPGDVDQLATRIVTLLSRPDLASRMGCHARRKAEDKFSAERMAIETAAIYDEVCCAQGRAARS